MRYDNPNYRKKFDAFLIIDKSGLDPLKEAINAALEIEDPMARCHAWIKVAEFVYAKPKQQIEHSGSLTLEQLLGHWDQPKPIAIGEAG